MTAKEKALHFSNIGEQAAQLNELYELKINFLETCIERARHYLQLEFNEDFKPDLKHLDSILGMPEGLTIRW